MKIIVESIADVAERDPTLKGCHVSGRTPESPDDPHARRVYLQLYIPSDHADFDTFKVGQEIEL
jgi:hypothetical protein